MLSKVDFHGKPCSRGQTYADKLRGCDARANTSTHPWTLSKMPLKIESEHKAETCGASEGARFNLSR